jgi:F420-dependent oxidoreductase-like protein
LSDSLDAVVHPLRIGVKLSPQNKTIASLRTFWRLADETGFDHLWVYDHLAAVVPPWAPDTQVAELADVFESWTLLAAMASETSRIRIGCLVTATTFRHPGVLAKMAMTVDHLSGGRLEFGLGAGWNQREHAMLDLPFGGARERIERLEEAIRVIGALWGPEPRVSFHGNHYTLRDATFAPKPLQKPYPPLWLGGTGEKRLLRLVAEHADVWNISDTKGVDEAVRLSGVLDRWCDEIGRDPKTVRRSVQLQPDPTRVVEEVEPWVTAGFTEIVLHTMSAQPLGELEMIAARLPQLRAL